MEGQPNKQIAAELGCSERTVKAHRAQVMTKMGATSLADLVRLVRNAESDGGLTLRASTTGVHAIIAPWGNLFSP